MTTNEQALGDLLAAIARLHAAQDEDEQRRALNEALSCLYRLRERLVAGHPRAKAYFAAAVRPGPPEGRLLEAIVHVRGRGDHDYSRDVAPAMAPLHPGPDVLPSPRLFPGANLCWRPRRELKHDLGEPRDGEPPADVAEKAAWYDEHLSGQPVLVTLEATLTFLRREIG